MSGEKSEPSKAAVTFATRIYAEMFGHVSTDPADVNRMVVLAIAFDSTAQASREAVRQRRERGTPLDGPPRPQLRNEDWALAEKCGVHVDTIRMRRKRGLPIDGPSRSRDPRTCKACGETGHFAKTCVSAGKVSP